MDKNKNRIVAIAVITLLILLAVFLTVRTFFFGTVTLKVEGSHDPVTNSVFIDGNPLLPSGNEGRTYIYRGRIGEYSLSVYGPAIKKSSEQAEITPNGNTSITINSESLTEEDIISNTIPGIEVSSSAYLLFGDVNDWIVVKSEPKRPSETSTFYVLNYVNDSWIVIESGRKINARDSLLADAPAELISYLEDQAGD